MICKHEHLVVSGGGSVSGSFEIQGTYKCKDCGAEFNYSSKNAYPPAATSLTALKTCQCKNL